MTSDLLVLCTGWAFRYLPLGDGRRQIVKFLLPGDVLSPALALDPVSGASVKALTPVQVVAFSRSEVEMRSDDVALRRAITRSLIEDSEVTERLLAVVAHKAAEERMAYLLLHLMGRIAAKSVIREERYPFPLRQHHIADAIGLTTVHVSRVLSGFRDRRILALAGGVLEILNRRELESMVSLK